MQSNISKYELWNWKWCKAFFNLFWFNNFFVCYDSLLSKLPGLIKAHNPKLITLKKWSRLLKRYETFDPCSFTAHEVWMYCTFFGLHRLQLTSVYALSMVFLMQPHVELQLHEYSVKYSSAKTLWWRHSQKGIAVERSFHCCLTVHHKKTFFLIKVGHGSTSSWSSPVHHTFLPLIKLP